MSAATPGFRARARRRPSGYGCVGVTFAQRPWKPSNGQVASVAADCGVFPTRRPGHIGAV